MRWLRWLAIGIPTAYIGGHILAYALGQTPDVFFTQTLPYAVGWLIGVGIFITGLGIIIMQLSRR